MKTAYSVEGPTDMLAALSKNPEATVVCNAFGAGEKPGWMAEAFKGYDIVNVVRDCDRPGQEGAGRWVQAIAKHVDVVRNVILPYAITENHGKDLRDYFADGHSWADFEALCESSADASEVDVEADRSDVDPTRLAQINLAKYSTKHGRSIRFWRDEFFKWTGKYYKPIKRGDLHAKLWSSIDEEFVRLYRESVGTKDEKPVRQVNNQLVSNVMKATASLTLISSDVERGSWIDDREQKNWVSLDNGILDLDALLAGEQNPLRPHDPRWFTLSARPYAFDPDADCPIWKKYLNTVMEGDGERIQLLQEWAGYLLLNDTTFAKFLIMEGDGSNGKSVYCAGIRAMLGNDSCSAVPLEVFGDRFAKSQTLGKLVNICTDVGELDKICEGYLKAYTSGDTQFFDRKGIPGIDTIPTARLMIGTNNRPRFSDKSSGIWRRILIVPFEKVITKEERIRGMDRSKFWEAKGELPGMFNWAVCGLHRIRRNDDFTIPQICVDELEEYRNDNNPAREFLQQHYKSNSMSNVSSQDVYEHYREWCRKNGNREMSNRSFGKEVFRVFPQTKRRKLGARSERFYAYEGIIKTDDEEY